MKILDLTHTYESGQLAGDKSKHPVVELKRMGKIEKTGSNTSSILLGSHTGTHMDAPKHFIAEGEGIDDVDLSICVGDVTVVDFSRFGKGHVVEIEDVEGLQISQRMLFSFDWAQFYDTPRYGDQWPRFSVDAAEYLVKKGVRLMAMDTIGVDPKGTGSGSDFRVHKSLLRDKIIFVENIANTDRIDFKKKYTIMALPLKLKCLDASPCRVILIEK